MPGTPTASKITGSVTAPPSMEAPARSITDLATPKAAQRSCGDSTAGSITSSAPNASASRRRVGEKSAASTGPWPRPLSAAITARPTGPHPTTRHGWPSGEVGQADGVLAHGERLGQRGEVGVEPVGHRQQQHLLEHHVLGQRARVAVGVADLLDAGRPDDDRHGAHPGADRQGAGGVGPVLDDLGAELVAEHAVGRRVQRRHADRSMSPVKCAKSASAWRSDPQMPVASERTTTWPDDGTGSATSPTTSCPPRVTAARMRAHPPHLERPSGGTAARVRRTLAR